MFAGIVEEKARVANISVTDSGARLKLISKLDQSETRVGDSICVEGVCLTVVEVKDSAMYFEMAPETLRRSTLAQITPNQQVNLERSLKIGDRIHGHFVFGHVDSMARILSVVAEGESMRIEIEIPEPILDLIAKKGSISVNGVSLTVGEVNANSFFVYIVPHTLVCTTFSDIKPGDMVNLEADMLARYVKAQRARN